MRPGTAFCPPFGAQLATRVRALQEARRRCAGFRLAGKGARSSNKGEGSPGSLFSASRTSTAVESMPDPEE